MKLFDKTFFSILNITRYPQTLNIVNRIGMIDDYNMIIPNLYLGNYKMASNLDFLNKHNIQCIINCTEDVEFDPYFDNKHKLRLDINDSKESDNINSFKEKIINSIDFIDNCLEENKPVYVHCYYGLMRSATVISAYLIKKYKIPKELSINIVKEQRPRALSSLYNFNEVLDFVEGIYVEENEKIDDIRR